jgi:hypothetical protein
MKPTVIRVVVAAMVIFGVVLMAQERNSGLAAVEGRVVRVGTAEPIGNAVVALAPATGSAKTVITDADGKFTLELTAGRYGLTVSRPGFVRAAGGPVDLNLMAGERIKDLRLQLTATGIISGRVVDAKGTPTTGAVVTGIRATYVKGRRVMSPCSAAKNLRVVSNDKGEYRLFDLEPGEYYLAVQGNNSCSSASDYYPGVTDPADAVKLAVHAGAELGGLDLRLIEANRFVVRFRIVQAPYAFGTPGPVFQVTRRSRDGLQTTELLMMLARLEQRPDGVSVSPPLPPGSYDFYYSLDLIPTQMGHLSVDIVDRDVDAGDLVVGPTTAIAGHLRIAGAVLEERMLRNVTIRLMALDGRETVLDRPRTRLFADPSFSLSVAQGQYIVEVGGLPSNFYVDSIRYGAREVDRLSVEGDSSPSSLEITVNGLGGTVNGVVLNALSEPVNSQVVLIPPPGLRHNPTLFKTVSTDQYGRFSIEGIRPGEHGLIASQDVEPGAFINEEFLRRFEQRLVKVKLERGTQANVELRVISVGGNR